MWEKARIVSILIASVLIPIIIAVIGNSYTKAIKQNYMERVVEFMKGKFTLTSISNRFGAQARLSV